MTTLNLPENDVIVSRQDGLCLPSFSHKQQFGFSDFQRSERRQRCVALTTGFGPRSISWQKKCVTREQWGHLRGLCGFQPVCDTSKGDNTEGEIHFMAK